MRTDGFREVQYSRMLVGLGAFIVVGCAIAVGAVFGSGARSLVLLAGVAGMSIAVWRTRLVLSVTASGVQVPPAHIAWSAVSSVEPLDAQAMRQALSVQAHPSDYLRVRGTRAGIRLWIDDATDPHRCWIVSVRDARSLRATLDALRTQGVLHGA